MMRALGLIVGFAPVWGILVASSVFGRWWYGFAFAALIAAVAGFAFLGLWIEGDL